LALDSESDLTQVEYDLDEEDERWLLTYGAELRITPEEYEYMLDTFDKDANEFWDPEVRSRALSTVELLIPKL